MQCYRLALLILSGCTAVAIVFLMGLVTFLESPKQLLINVSPSDVYEYFPADRTSYRQVGYSPEGVNNGSYAAFNRMFNASTTAVVQSLEPHYLDLQRPKTASADHANSSLAELLNLTMARLRLRVHQRLSRAGTYLAATAHILTEYQTTNRSALLLACNLESKGGLGNWMFMVASVFGLACTNHRVPVVLYDYPWAYRRFASFSLQRMNQSTFFGSDDEQSWRDFTWNETAAGKYRADLANLTTEKNVAINGLLQSWKYFDAYRDDIRSLFTFSADVYNYSLNRIETLLQSYWNSSREPIKRPVLVGIHVRRGDITTPFQINFGFYPATEEYFLHAVKRFQQDYNPVVFVVVSDDMAYCRKLFAGLGQFLFVENTGRVVHMATMTLMDHLILSVGTFSWWTGYLSDAKTIMYFKDWPRNGSEMKGMYTDEDFFYPAWTPYE